MSDASTSATFTAPTTPTGVSLVAGRAVAGTGSTFSALRPGTTDPSGPAYRSVSDSQMEQAVEAAVEAAESPVDPAAMAALLDDIADRLEQAGDAIIAVADQETALGTTRLTGELGRTGAQFRMMASEAGGPSRQEHVIDPAGDGPAAPALLRTSVPIGVVGVFAASNFPLAFGVAGTDTSAALGAGCPVVTKAHPAQPGTGELVGRVMADAVAAAGLHPGFVSVLHEEGHEVGAALVQHDGVDAVAFTGSLRGGRALFDLATARERPIPVYAEMGSLNPVVVSPGAAAARGAALVEAIVGSFLLGEGQFCTKPGLIVLPDTPAGKGIRDGLTAAVAEYQAGHPLLHPGIVDGFESGLAEVTDVDGVTVHTGGSAPDGSCVAAVIDASVSALQDSRVLRDELFGPATVVVLAGGSELSSLISALDPSLTGTLHFEADEAAWARPLADQMSRKVGRVIANGFPTGVRVSPAQHHGGPYPATTSPLHTSVGLAAIDRFRRPVAFQSFDSVALPTWAGGVPAQ